MAAVGPGIPVTLPDPGPTPVGSLVSSMAAPPAEFKQDPHWTGGINWSPRLCSDGRVLSPCDLNTSDTLADAPTLATETPYIVDAGVRASARGFDAINYEGRAIDALLRNRSKKIEAEFWDGAKAQTADFTGNFYLTGNATDIGVALGDGVAHAYKVKFGFGELERRAMADLGGGQAMFHVTPDLVTWLSDAHVIEARGNVLYTKLGNIVVAGAGYSGSGPSAAVDTTGKTTWAFATGVGFLWLSDIVVNPQQIGQALDRTVDAIEYRASQFAAVTVDRCVDLAVKLDLNNS